LRFDGREYQQVREECPNIQRPALMGPPHAAGIIDPGGNRTGKYGIHSAAV